MRLIILFAASGFLAATFLGGCASNDGLGLTTASLEPTKAAAAKPTIDPACVTLAAQINDARAEGTPGRVSAVATAENKSRIVNIKRASLAKVAKLDKLNAEFQARCSTVPTRAAAAPPQTTALSSTKTAATTAATKAATSAATTAAASATSKVAAKAQTVATKAVTKTAQSSVTAAATPKILNANAAR